MSHERDREHPPQPAPPHPQPAPKGHGPGSEPCPDRKRSEHPTVVPREPIDPRPHPSRRPFALRARPA